MQKPNEQLLRFDLNEIAHGLALEIFAEHNSRVRQIESDLAKQFDENTHQLFEGHSYEYEFVGESKFDYRLQTAINGVIIPSNRHPYRGRITPNIYVGNLNLQVVNTITGRLHPIFVEVVATKFDKEEDRSYRENYRKMLEDITDKCTELLMQINTPITQKVTIDYSTDTVTLYQRFCFVKSFLESIDFEEAILRIISNPSTTWSTEDTMIKYSQIKRVNRSVTKQLVNASNRIDTSNVAFLDGIGLHSIPSSITSTTRRESIDTPENRFIKHVLQIFLNFVEDCKNNFYVNNYQTAFKESTHLIEKLNTYLSYSFFNEISEASTLKLNSPLLQKRSGYRELLSRWLQFDLASQLIWKGGEDVYDAGKRDIAILYEYWLFFQLYDLIIEKFNLQNYQHQNFEHLFESYDSGMSLKLKTGKELIIKGETHFASRSLSVRFSYNRTFKGGNKYVDKKSGSITTTLRPDYTLSIWPSSFTESEAESEEVITHIHFDAKYKIQNIRDQYTETDDEYVLERIEERERKGTFKNIDLLKMHAYKDAIRRTGGAYILYPGSVEKRFDGFHEVLPGLGAFTINPSLHDTGIKGLSDFLDQIILHLVDRTTHRERITNVSNNILKEPLLQYGRELKAVPKSLERKKVDLLNTYVLVGYAKSSKHLAWYISKGLYNFRMNDNTGSLELSAEVVQAKYLLLRESGKDIASKLFRITSKGPKVYTKDRLIKLGYDNPSQSDYLVVSIEPCTDWDPLKIPYKDFIAYKDITGSPYSKLGKAFIVTLDQILKK